MSKYTINCSKEQIEQSLKLGAGEEFLTAEEMIGWLEEQGLYFSIECIVDYVYEVWTKDEGGSKIIINSCINTRPEANLAAIDAALEYLTNKKK